MLKDKKFGLFRQQLINLLIQNPTGDYDLVLNFCINRKFLLGGLFRFIDGKLKSLSHFF